MIQTSALPDAHNIRSELARILASDEFRTSDRRSRLLRFLVERALKGESSHVKEYVLGIQVFEKPTDYDPRIDPAVRVEMSRVRTKLAEYYDGGGHVNPMRIEFPKGTYAPTFRTPEPLPIASPALRAPLFRPWRAAFLVLAIGAACSGVWRFVSHNAKANSSENAHVAQLCAKARFFWNKRTPESLRTSLELYQEAIRSAPRYAPAYAGEAMCYAVMATNSELPAAEMSRYAVEAANEAIALDPNIAEAHAALGLVAYGVDSDWKKAESELGGALRLDPNFATAHQWRALSLLYVGRFDEAGPEIGKALALDPVSMPLCAADGMVSYYSRHYDEAIVKARKMLEMDPSFREAHLMLGQALEAERDWAGAEREFLAVALASTGDSEGPARLAHLYALTDRREKAEEILEKLLSPLPDQYVDPYQLAFIYTALKRKTEAFEWLGKAVRQRTAIIMKVDPYLDPLRGEPEFPRLLAEARLN